MSRRQHQDLRQHDQGQVAGGDRKTFNIQNDFTPEEEDQIRRENELAHRVAPLESFRTFRRPG
jgi:hypothetical protein